MSPTSQFDEYGLRTLFETIVGRAPVGVGVVDHDLRYVYVNDVLAVRNGLPAEAHLGRAVDEVIPDLAEQVMPVFRQVLTSGVPMIDWRLVGPAPAEPRMTRTWSENIYRVELGQRQRGVAAVVTDATEQLRAERRLRRLIDGLFSFVGLLDPEGRILEANQTALSAVGLEREDVIGRPFWETPWWQAGPAERDELRRSLSRARAGETVRYDVDITVAGGQILRMDFQLVPIVEDGAVTAIVPSGIDVTTRRRESARSLALASFAQALAVASDTDEVAEAVRSHLGPSLDAEFANVALVNEGSDDVRVFNAATVSAEITDRYTAIPLNAPTPLTDAIRSGRIVVNANRAERVERYPALVEEADRAGLVATISVPLTSEDGVLGAIGLGFARELEVDASLEASLEIVGQLTAGSFERTRTSDTHAALIAELQRAVLPTVPPRDGLDIALRYQAAGAGLGFGGDWYDVISLNESTTAVVVGDVVGHGIEAAAKMVAVRSALNVAMHLQLPIEDVFGDISAAISEDGGSFLGTATVLVIDTAAGTLRYARAGHPPTIVCGPDGSTLLLDGANNGPLGLAVRHRVARTVDFPAGSVLVSYTDGLVERRARAIDEGIEDLTATLAACSADDADAEQIADAVLSAAGDAADLNDDIALVIARNVGHR